MTRSYYATSDFAVGRLGRVLCFSRQFQFYGYERRAHGTDDFGGNNTTR